MKRKNITIQEAEEIWEKIKDNEFTLIFYSTFDDYWKECKRINSLSDKNDKNLSERTKKNYRF